MPCEMTRERRLLSAEVQCETEGTPWTKSNNSNRLRRAGRSPPS